MKKRVLFLSQLLLGTILGMVCLAAFANPVAGGVVFAMSLTGYVKACGKKSSGVNSLYLAVKSDVSGHTKSVVAGERAYSSIAMATGKVFKKYEFDQNQCEFKESLAVANGAMVFTQTIEFHLNAMSQTSAMAVMELVNASASGLEAIVVDSMGNKWVVGYCEEQGSERSLAVSANEGTTGKALGDDSGEKITLTCTTTEKAYAFTGSVPIAPAA